MLQITKNLLSRQSSCIVEFDFFVIQSKKKAFLAKNRSSPCKVKLEKRRSVLKLGQRGYRFGGRGWGKVCMLELIFG